MLLEKTLQSPLDCKEIQSVHPKGNQSWIFVGRTDAETETPILWPPDVKNWLIGRLWCWERLKAGGKGDDRGWDDWMASQLMSVRHEFEQAPGVGDGQGRLVCCSPWGHKESDMTEWLNWTELIFLLAILIPACASSSPGFCMMYSAYKLNKQGDNIQPWHTTFPTLNQSLFHLQF